MYATLSIAGLDVVYGARTLVHGIDLVVPPLSVAALVGRNGSGKSSLMRMLVGELPVSSGRVQIVPADATIGWLPQSSPDPHESLLDYCRRRTGVATAEANLVETSDALATGIIGAEDAYALALERWLALGGTDLEERVSQVAAQVGLHATPDRPLGSLSGGESARVALSSVLLSRYDVLLLDEPSNNLDAAGLELVTEFVNSHKGPVVVASHDRQFLDDVATKVVELDPVQQRVSHYTGGWSAYIEARNLRQRQALVAHEMYVESRDHLVAQGRQRAQWASKGLRNAKLTDEPDKNVREKIRARADRQAGRSARALRAAELLTPVPQPRKEWQLRYSIDPGPLSADVVWTLDRVEVVRGELRLGPIDLVIQRGQRVAIAGANGIGKTTLLATMLGQLAPTSGRVSRGARARIGVLDQDRACMESETPVIDLVRTTLGNADGSAVRSLLAKFGLGAEHVARPARTLSMGERTRVMMATFQARHVNVLCLDEPTNHLDVAGIEQLETALARYSGTIVVVTHDRTFLSRIKADRLVDLTPYARTETNANRSTTPERLAKPARSRDTRPRDPALDTYAAGRTSKEDRA